MESNKFISELEECILANSSSPSDAPRYTTEELATMYLNGDYENLLIEEYDEDEEDDDVVQVIYIDDNNFSRLDPSEMKNFIDSLSKILGTNPYTEEDVTRFISQYNSKKPKE